MTKLEPGTIAYLKTTQEPCFILSIKPLDATYHVLSGVLSGLMARVRRPNVDEKGRVVHNIEEFLLDELETKEDMAMRQVREMDGLKASLKAQQVSGDESQLARTN